MTPTDNNPDVRMQRWNEAKERALANRDAQKTKDEQNRIDRNVVPVSTMMPAAIPMPKALNDNKEVVGQLIRINNTLHALPREITKYSASNFNVPSNYNGPRRSYADDFIGPRLPLPVKIEDDVARESTQGLVVDNLETINGSITDGLSQLQKDLMKVSRSNEDLIADMAQFNDVGHRERASWMTMLTSGTYDAIRNLSTKILGQERTDKLVKTVSPLVAFAQKQTEYLQSIRKDLKKYTDRIFQVAMAGRIVELRGRSADVSDDNDIHDVGWVEGLSRRNRGVAVVYGMWKWFDSVGGKLADQFRGESRSFFSDRKTESMLGNFLVLPTIAKWFVGLAGILSSVAGIAGVTAVVAPIYAAIKNPEQMEGYLEAFGKMWRDNFQPFITWIGTEFVPVIVVIFAGVLLIAEKVLDSIGTNINAGIIPALEQLSNIMTFLGKIFLRVWNYITTDMIDIEKNAIEASKDILSLVGDLVDLLFTEIGRSISIGGVQLISDDEKWSDAWGRVWGAFSDGVDGMVENIHSTANQWKDIVFDKVSSFVDTIISIIPTAEDIKALARWTIENTFGETLGGIMINSMGLNPTVAPPQVDSTGASLLDQIDRLSVYPTPEPQEIQRPVVDVDLGRQLLDQLDQISIYAPPPAPINDDHVVVNPPPPIERETQPVVTNYPHSNNVVAPINRPGISTPVIINAPTQNNNQSQQVINNQSSRPGTQSTQPQQSVWDRNSYNFGF